jgi:hypothetical protein
MLPVLADGTNRTTTSDTRLGPYLIPRGTMVWVPLKGLFNSPHNWPDPDTYKPVRSYTLLYCKAPCPSLLYPCGDWESMPRAQMSFSSWDESSFLSRCLQARWEDPNAEYALPRHSDKADETKEQKTDVDTTAGTPSRCSCPTFAHPSAACNFFSLQQGIAHRL